MVKVVKVRVLGETIPVDIESWALTFGTEATASAVREDVLSYIKNAVQQLQVWEEVTEDYLK